MSTLVRRALLVSFGSLLVACGSEAATEMGDAETNAASSASPSATLERFAGTWVVHARNEARDSLPTHTLTATADPGGWSVTFPDRPVIPARVVEASGDLVVIETEPYESVLRPGVRVRVLFVHRLVGDRITGRLWANYDVAGAAAILRGTTDGARAP